MASATESNPAGHARKPLPAASTKTLSAGDPSPQPSLLHHKVKSGETFYSIATAYNTTVAALKRSNRNVATLHPGMILLVQPGQ
jgi:LysM repeat protein